MKINEAQEIDSAIQISKLEYENSITKDEKDLQEAILLSKLEYEKKLTEEKKIKNKEEEEDDNHNKLENPYPKTVQTTTKGISTETQEGNKKISENYLKSITPINKNKINNNILSKNDNNNTQKPFFDKPLKEKNEIIPIKNVENNKKEEKSLDKNGLLNNGEEEEKKNNNLNIKKSLASLNDLPLLKSNLGAIKTNKKKDIMTLDDLYNEKQNIVKLIEENKKNEEFLDKKKDDDESIYQRKKRLQEQRELILKRKKESRDNELKNFKEQNV